MGGFKSLSFRGERSESYTLGCYTGGADVDDWFDFVEVHRHRSNSDDRGSKQPRADIKRCHIMSYLKISNNVIKYIDQDDLLKGINTSVIIFI